MKRVTIGLACLYFPNFQAAEYEVYKKSLKAMIEMAERFDFDLVYMDEMISTEDEARKASGFFKSKSIDFLLLQASSLILGDIILPLAEASEKIGFWLVPEPTLKGELPLNSLTGFNLGVSILRKNYPDRHVKWYYGDPGCKDPSFLDRLDLTVKALRCLKNLKGSRIGLVHDVVPTFINLTYDSGELKNNLGVEVVKIALEEVFKQAKTDDENSENISGEMSRRAARVNVPISELRKSGRISNSLINISEKNRLDALALRCWPEFQDEMMVAPCASISYLNDHGLITSCEGDLPGAVSMLAAWFISREAPTMNDPVAVDMDENLIQMWHCGPGPASWADDEGQTLDWHHTLNRRIADGENKSGLSSDISFKKGAVTLLHISGDGKSLFVMEGDVVKGPSKPYPGSGGWIGKLSSNGRPCTVGDFLESITVFGLEHHYPVMRGHHEAVIREFAAWTGIEIMEIPKAERYLK